MLEHLLSSDPEPLHTISTEFVPAEESQPVDIVNAKINTDLWLKNLGVETPESQNPAYERALAAEAFGAVTGTGMGLTTKQQQEKALALRSPQAVSHITTMLSAYDWEFVNQAKQLRGYIVAKLVDETENPKPEIRMKALKLLGEVTEVALFTQRTEVVTKNLSDDQIEAEINKRLERLTHNPDTPLVERVNNEVDDE